jgi:hypothetical protein
LIAGQIGCTAQTLQEWVKKVKASWEQHPPNPGEGRLFCWQARGRTSLARDLVAGAMHMTMLAVV